MGVQLQSFVDRCVGIAESRGLSSNYPITLKVKESTDGAETLVVVSYTEPYQMTLPINVSWIDGDPDSDDYKLAFKRESKISSGGLNHTWVELSSYEDIFEPEQYYLLEDTPMPMYSEEQLANQMANAVDKTGDQLEGALLARTLGAGEEYQPEELIPKSFQVSEQNSQTQGFYNIILNIYRRLGLVEALAAENDRRLDELDLTGNDGGDGSNGGGGTTDPANIGTFIHVQEQASDVWIVEHNLGTDNLIYQVKDAQGDMIIPEIAEIDSQSSNNTSTITFSEAITGKVLIVSIVS